MITFVISKDNLTKEIQLEVTDTFLHLKECIVKEFSCQCLYVDLNFLLDKPIRSLGKFNLEKGLFPRTLDRYKLDRYELDGKTIPVTFIEIDDYNPTKLNRVQLQSKGRGRGNTSGVYKPKQLSMKSGDEISVYEAVYTGDINSHDDFPPLVSSGVGRGKK